jgi:hypothetical protein
MSQPWGRADGAGVWPNRRPLWTLAVLLLAIASGVAVGADRYRRTWTPLERLYLSAYVRSALASGLAARSRYHLLEIADSATARTAKTRLALDEEVTAVVTDAGETTWTLSDEGLATGDRRLVWLDVSYDHQALHRLLGHWIYADQTLTDLAAPGAWTIAVVFGLGLVIAIPKDAARARERRHGRRLRGPELVSVDQFNRRLHADGIGFSLYPSLLARLLKRPSILRLPRGLESSHVMLIGDTGTGKSAIIRQLLQQIAARGDTAIIYDPALEYTPQFYSPARGDIILNPLDTRCPYWSPSDEIRHEAEALTLATSLYPDGDLAHRFFTEAPRRIFAHLLTFHPSPQTLVDWMCDERELDRRMAGTPYATMIDSRGPHQRTGVLASLNMVADALKLLPSLSTRRWSATTWAAQRRGWIFLTSTPETRDRLKPLISLWLDTLVLRLMRPGQTGSRPTWFVLDELASLQRLPQLHTALTENRKSNNPLVLGFQGRSQLEERYGRDADTMLSQPATKIFFRTSDAPAAKWVADTIGDIEIDRLSESRATRGGRQQSYGLQRQVEPLVMASEIGGLSNLHGYLKVGNLVVRLRVPYVDLPKTEPDFLLRLYPPTHLEELPLPADTDSPAAPQLHLVPPASDRGPELFR